MPNRAATIREVLTVYRGALALYLPAVHGVGIYVDLAVTPPVPDGTTVSIGGALHFESTGLPRNSGAQDFDGTALDLIAALNDPANGAADLVIAKLTGAAVRLYGTGAEPLAVTSSDDSITVAGGATTLLEAAPAELAFFLAMALRMFDPADFLDKSSDAHALLTAHLLASSGIMGSAGERGGVTKRSFDKLSEEYATAAPATSSGGMGSSPFGRMFEALAAGVVPLQFGVTGRP